MRSVFTGDSIRIVLDCSIYDDRYKVGDIFTVAISCDSGDVYIDRDGDTPIWLLPEEYEKLNKEAF